MELELWKILVLAVVQGVTEFLPVSSSGHLVILAALLSGGNTDQLDVADVNIVLHLGTLGSVLVFYRNQLLALLTADRQTIVRVMVASIPAACVGIPIMYFAKGLLESPLLAGCMLPVTALVLWLASRIKPGETEYQELSLTRSLAIGVAQAFAVLPGLSRSGTTIAAGVAVGLRPKAAATFSFMMAVVAIGGAGLIESLKIMKHGLNTAPSSLLIGAAVSFATGLFALAALMRLLEKGRFAIFSIWCTIAGVSIIAWQLS